MIDKKLKNEITMEASKISSKSYFADYNELMNAVHKVLMKYGKTFDDLRGGIINLGNSYVLNDDGILDNNIERKRLGRTSCKIPHKEWKKCGKNYSAWIYYI